MKVGDLIRVVKDNFIQESAYVYHQGQLAVVVDAVVGYGETKVKMISDGAELWFLTTELEDGK